MNRSTIVRRIAVGMALAVSATVLPMVSPSVAAAEPLSPTIQRIPISGVDPDAVSATDATATRRPLAVTGPQPTNRFDLVALTWNGAAPNDASFQVRVRESGQWGQWHTLGPAEDHAPDAGSAEAARAAAAPHASEPLLTDHADGVQVRMDGSGTAPANLTAVLVDGGRSAADVAPGGNQTAMSATSQPRIITRAQWGADESLAAQKHVINSTVKELFVHHTETTNAYTASGAAAQIRSVYAFHTKVRGWDDIGYNFLVDRFGRVYEGRRGSITAAVRGAHTGGFNTDSMGISVLGGFTSVDLPGAARSALISVLAWKASQYFINPLGRTTLVSAGGGTTRFPAGKAVSLLGISGHRDVGYTACPGNSFYPDLQGIRRAVATRLRPGMISPAFSASSVSYAGSPISFTAAMPTQQRWAVVVTPMCTAAPVAVYSGRSANRLTATWDLRDKSGNPVPPGVYRMRVTVVSAVGSTYLERDVEVGSTPTSPVSTCRARRPSTGEPITTSVLAGRERYPDARTIVLAARAAPLDALLAAPLATTVGGPLLLTESASLPSAIVAEIARRGVTRAYLVGSPTAITPKVQAQLSSLGVATITRLSGSDRYATAAQVARIVGGRGYAMVASGTSLNDVAAAAGPAAALKRPILLVSPTGVPPVTGIALRGLGIWSAVVIGDRTRLGDVVPGQLGAYGVTSRPRIGAADAAGTAAAVAYAYRGPVSPTAVVVVTPADLPHAAIGAAQGRLMLFTGARTPPAVTSSFLRSQKTRSVSLFAPPQRVAPSGLRGLYAATG